MKSPFWPLAPLLVLSAGLLSGCPDEELTRPDLENGQQGSLQTPSGAPIEFPRLSEQESAKYTDVAVGADGAVHVIYQDQSKQNLRPQVYYRASTDGGKTWSANLNLLDGDDKSQAGFIRLALDGDGRVYAFWKTYAGFDIVNPAGGSVGTLTYRVLTGGAWSPATKVGTEGQVASWFPAVAPDGRVHLVWSETIALERGYSPEWQAGRIRQAPLTGAAVGAPRDVLQATAQPVGSSGVVNYDGYTGLSGYVDAQGNARFVALKIPTKPEVGAPSKLQDIVYWDGQKEVALLSIARLEAVLKPITSHPPALVLDAAGREHLLVANQGQDRAALQDYSPVTAPSPTTVFQLKSAKGDFRSFTARPNGDGKFAVMIAANDTDNAAARHDMFALAFDGATWKPAVNLTTNAEREAFASRQTSADTEYSKLTQYSGQYGTGAIDVSGKLHLAFVNTEITSIMRTTETTAGTGGAFGSNSTTNVFFHRL